MHIYNIQAFTISHSIVDHHAAPPHPQTVHLYLFPSSGLFLQTLSHMSSLYSRVFTLNEWD